MLKSTKKISKKPFELMGFTLEDYLRWCEKKNLIPYLIKNKKEFFNRVNSHLIVKRKDKLFDGREEI